MNEWAVIRNLIDKRGNCCFYHVESSWKNSCCMIPPLPSRYGGTVHTWSLAQPVSHILFWNMCTSKLYLHISLAHIQITIAYYKKGGSYWRVGLCVDASSATCLWSGGQGVRYDAYKPNTVRYGTGGGTSHVYYSVLWSRIKIRSDPKLFAGSETGSVSVTINFGSGSYELQFFVTKIAQNLLRPHWLLKILLLGKKIQLDFKNLFFKIKINVAVLVKNFGFASLLIN